MEQLVIETWKLQTDVQKVLGAIFHVWTGHSWNQSRSDRMVKIAKLVTALKSVEDLARTITQEKQARANARSYLRVYHK